MTFWMWLGSTQCASRASHGLSQHRDEPHQILFKGPSLDKAKFGRNHHPETRIFVSKGSSGSRLNLQPTPNLHVCIGSFSPAAILRVFSNDWEQIGAGSRASSGAASGARQALTLTCWHAGQTPGYAETRKLGHRGHMCHGHSAALSCMHGIEQVHTFEHTT